MKTNRKRKLPRSRQEMRAHTASTLPTTIPATTIPVVPVATLPLQIAPPPVSNCLYSPYECSVYKHHPSVWCSSCQVRASSMCAQLGYPDIRTLFSPPPCAYTAPPPCAYTAPPPCAYTAPSGYTCPSACAPPPCVRPTMCPTSVNSSPSC